MHDDGELVSGSEAMRQVFKRIGLAADSDATVLVLGETGTGKELVARALHRNSVRAERPFVAVNCAAIPADLMESELFGHVKGAFTGAASDRAGRFREAQGGTLFLDEVGDMPLPTQAKILRALQEREITPVGASRALPVNVRIIAATHRDLPDAVRQGAFARISGTGSRSCPCTCRRCASAWATCCCWPSIFCAKAAAPRPSAWGRRRAPAAGARLARQRARAAQRHGARGPAVPRAGHRARAHRPAACGGERPRHRLERAAGPAVAQLEREMVTRALAATMGNRAEAARRLGLSRQQLYRKLAEFGLG